MSSSIDNVPNDVDLKYFINNPPKSWENLFKNSKDELLDIFEVLENINYFPSNKQIFRPFYETPLDQVKVVIFGNTPNINSNGLAYSSDKEESQELKKIKQKLEKDIMTFTSSSNSLISWAKQGVLLINRNLTMSRDLVQDIWKGFIKKVIEEIQNKNKECIFVLWGNQNLLSFIKYKNNILSSQNILINSKENNFMNSNHFEEINIRLGIEKSINWNII